MEEVGMPQGKQKLQHENIFFKVGLSMIRNLQYLAFVFRMRTPWPTTTWRLVRCSSFSWRSVAGGRNRMCRTILGFGNYCSHYTYCQVFVLGMNVWVGCQMFLFSTFQALSTFSHIIDTCHLVSPGTTLYNLVPPGTTWHHPVSTSYRPVKNRISPQLWAPLFLSHICIYAQTNLIHLSIIIYTSQNTMTPRTLLPEQC